jgi:CheY-like chemotaxis protein
LTKPVKQSSLMDTLAELMYQSARRVPSARSATSETGGHKPSRPSRVLLVEDNAVNRRVAVGMLGKLGSEVTEAQDGQAALECLERASFDLVLMDVQMPNMDGFQATAAIRANPQWAEMPVIAMTAHAMKGDRERCLQAGMDDYIAKPIRLEDLRVALDKWVGATHCAQVRPGDAGKETIMAKFGGSPWP